MPFTIDEAAVQLDTAVITWLGKSCTITAVSVATMAQLRANWPGAIPPKDAAGAPDFASPVYQARIMADQKEMDIIELGAAIDFAPAFGYTVGGSAVTRNPKPMGLSEVLTLPENEKGPATEEWCKATMKWLGGMSGDKLKPIMDAYAKLGAADVSAGARGN